jgi:hypothetical protein
MRNSLGGLVGVLLGSSVLVMLVNLVDPIYFWPYNSIWFILSGSDALRLSLEGFLNPDTITGYVIAWFIIGVILGFFSKRGWNTLRSAIWTGIILGILSLASVLLLNSEFWGSPTRDIDLMYHFGISIIISLCAIPSAIPTTLAIERIRKQAEEPIPEKIETSCECGAVFKSNPLICSECGRQLREV